MSILLRIYPGDAVAFLIANVFVQVTVVVLTAWLLARLGNRWNAAWRHAICVVALICVLASPILSWIMQASGTALATLQPSVPTALPTAPARLPVTHIPEPNLVETPASQQVGASRVELDANNLAQSLQQENSAAFSFPDILRATGGAAWVAWLLGMVLFSARWCYGLHLVALLRRAAQPLDFEGAAELLCQVRRVLGADHLPTIATSAGLDRPIMVGLIHPQVLLPENVLRTLREPELVDILVHECAHAVCRHQFIGALQRLAEMFFWPNPLVHLLNRELARAREELCDNYVLRRGNALRYARTLLELSQSLAGVSPSPAAINLFHGHWRLEDRIVDLLDQRRRVMIRVNRWTATVLTAAFMLLSLLIAGVRVVRAEPDAVEKTVIASTPSSPPDRSAAAADNSTAAIHRPIAGHNFMIVPFTTELQRAANWRYTNAKLFILINGKALLNDENSTLNTAALDFDGLSKALTPYFHWDARAQTDVWTRASIMVIEPSSSSKSRPPSTSPVLASFALLALLNERFRVYDKHADTKKDIELVVLSCYRDDWDSLVADLVKPPTDDDIRREDGVGDDLVKAYPICTSLSRDFYLSRSQERNCVIRNMKPLDQLTPEEIQMFPKKAMECVAQLALKQSPKVHFIVKGGQSSATANRVRDQFNSRWREQGFDVSVTATSWQMGQMASGKAE